MEYVLIAPVLAIKAKPDEYAPEIQQWAHRELKEMPMIIDVAIQLEKVLEFLVKAGFNHDKLLDFKPTKEPAGSNTSRKNADGHQKFSAEGVERSISRNPKICQD